MHCGLNMATTRRLLHLTTRLTRQGREVGTNYRDPVVRKLRMFVCFSVVSLSVDYILTLSDQDHVRSLQFCVKILRGPLLLPEGGGAKNFFHRRPDPLSAALLTLPAPWCHMASCFSSVLNMHAFCSLAPVVILAHCADFSAFGWLCWCHPTYKQRDQFLHVL